ncbi:MAG: subtype I-E CRISPR-associated endonuclease Cas1 [Lentisphaerae bacterium RIFOXYB12_FULL_65_16]|nr:MAG: subtype I-E CRISPR-associated endonuclease Cas1 [Lentisphaerae bacterium RIFOXYA12_64_32]OGV94034.1 MAG: subtype I-E CRISPR-associated endonuclease Cas1 [Lentisphaerae bacterium RIFOXYB12_FULL_65_16]
MPVFEKPPLETLTPVSERWTPLYLEHGRLEVDDSSVKWIGADRTVLRIPVATVSALMLGPGTTVTHAAIRACAVSNTPVCWIGEEGMHFYAFGATPTHDNERARRHAEAYANPKRRAEIARRMFGKRFPDCDVSQTHIEDLRLLEGRRVRILYQRLGAEYGVTWMGRNYNPNNWDVADEINRAVSAANAALYSLCTAVVCALGYLPELGFIHAAAARSFVLDVADMYKPETSLPAAFHAVSLNPKNAGADTMRLLKLRIEETKLLQRMPRDIEELFA